MSGAVLVLIPISASPGQSDSTGVAGSRGAARTSTMPEVARDVINETMSPFCPGLTLAACPSPAADSLRRAVVDLAEKGESRNQILDRLTSAYGDGVLGAPRKRGVGLLAWIMPVVILVLGGAWLVSWLRRSTQKRSGRGAVLPNAANGSGAVASKDAEGVAGVTDDELLRQLHELVSSDDR